MWGGPWEPRSRTFLDFVNQRFMEWVMGSVTFYSGGFIQSCIRGQDSVFFFFLASTISNYFSGLSVSDFFFPKPLRQFDLISHLFLTEAHIHPFSAVFTNCFSFIINSCSSSISQLKLTWVGTGDTTSIVLPRKQESPSCVCYWPETFFRNPHSTSTPFLKSELRKQCSPGVFSDNCPQWGF